MRPRIGLCSVTYRGLPPARVIELATAAGLESIEWASDAHVRPGDTAPAERIGEATRDAGLEVCSYGSYLGFPWQRGEAEHIDDVVASAVALGAPRIRAWAGPVPSAAADAAQRSATAAWVARLARAAAERDIEVALEFHTGTLTDNLESTLRLLDDLSPLGVTSYWQPRIGAPTAEALADLEGLGDRVSTIHVFSWWPSTERLPLDARESLWRQVADRVAGMPHVTDLLIEFVPDDDPGLLLSETAQLRSWLAGVDR